MSFSKNVITTFFTKLILLFLGIFASVIVARQLGPQGKGLYSFILLLPQLLLVAGNAGLRISNIYFLGRKKFHLQDVYSNSVITGAVLSILSMLVFTGVFIVFGEKYFKNIEAWHLAFILAAVPVLFFDQYSNGMLLGLQKIRQFNLLELAGEITKIALIVLTLWVFSMGLKGALISWYAAIFSVLLIYLWFFKKEKVKLGKINFKKEIFLESLKYGGKGYLGNIVVFLNYRLDVFLLAYFCDLKAIGFYSVSVALAEAVLNIPNSASLVLFPKISSAGREKKRGEFTSQVCRNILVLTGLLVLAAAVFGKKIILLFYSKAYSDSFLPFLILLPGVYSLSVSKILSSDLTGRGKVEINMYISAITLVANLILYFILIPAWGINGAALASTMVYILSAVLFAVFFIKNTDMKLKDLLVPVKSDLKAYRRLLGRKG